MSLEADATSPVAGKLSVHEQAAHEKRNWVRLTFDCNNHCVFCLDTLTHDGEMRDAEDVKRQILEGKRAGAERLILSGGEPTIHPRFVDFIKLGRLAGYKKIQTVTNGRLFGYPEFLQKCLDAGLQEITFSVHGPNAKIHDALVGVKGAFDQEVRGIELALADGRPIVNIDVVINRANVKHLRALLDRFIALGVKEYDLLQVIPFGNAYTEGKEILFYDLEAYRPHLLEAFELSKRPDLHLWLNRFPVQHLEGYEGLIQDPYKLNDEVRGRKEEYARLIEDGIDLDCRDPDRCKHCYLEQLCDTLYAELDRVRWRAFEAVRLDAGWEARQEAPFGGDPASAKRAKAEAAAKVGLPVFGQKPKPPPEVHTVEGLVAAAGAKELWLVATDLATARRELARFPGVTRLELQLADDAGLAAALDGAGKLDGRELVRCHATTPEQALRLLAQPAAFEVLVHLDLRTGPWLLGLAELPARLALLQPSHERLTESAARDLDLREFFGALRGRVPVEGVPACVTGAPPRERLSTLDLGMLGAGGQVEIFRYAKRYIEDRYRTRSLRCRGCVHEEGCPGMHVNYVRAHGYGVMQPVLAKAQADAASAGLDEAAIP